LLKNKSEIIRSKDLRFLISAGWIPGVSGVFPIYMAELAEGRFKKIHSLEIFISGKEKWSYGSCRDMIWAMFEDFSGVYENGIWVRKNIFRNSRKISLPAPSGKQWAYPMFNNQLQHFALARKYPLLAEYMGSEEFSFRTTLLIMYIRSFMKKNKEKAAALFQKASSSFAW
jgi:saccharopine dehydrogenase-like NADP-dependent oxidoreductase